MKEINTEIEDILSESPLEDNSRPKKIRTTQKKFKLPKKKTILILGGIILVIISITILFSLLNSTPITEQISNTEVINSIKQQIINKGYAEIGEGNSKMILAPYIQ